MAGSAVSVEEYLLTVYRPDCEYIDGEVVERNVGEFDHSRMQTSLASYLFERERLWAITTVIALREYRAVLHGFAYPILQ